jgi:iron-sulfur cluster repair protein YtfE (RIC family)
MQDLHEDEHLPLHNALSRVDRALRDCDLHTARLQLAIFAAGLDRYVRSEERVLFPVVERLVPAQRASTMKMRREHRSLRTLVDRVKDSLDGFDAACRLRVLGNLRSVFLLHMTKEEWVIYPLLHPTSP